MKKAIKSSFIFKILLIFITGLSTVFPDNFSDNNLNIRTIGSYSCVNSITSDEEYTYFATSGGVIQFDNESQEWLSPTEESIVDSSFCIIIHPFTGMLWLSHSAGISYRSLSQTWQLSPTKFRHGKFGYKDDALFIKSAIDTIEIDPFSGLKYPDSLTLIPDSITWSSCSYTDNTADANNIIINNDIQKLIPRQPWDDLPLPIRISHIESSGNEWLGTKIFGLFYRDNYYQNINHMTFGLWKGEVNDIRSENNLIWVLHRSNITQAIDAISFIDMDNSYSQWFFPGNSEGQWDMNYYDIYEGTIIFSDGKEIVQLSKNTQKYQVLLSIPHFITSLKLFKIMGNILYLADGKMLYSFNLLNQQLEALSIYPKLNIDKQNLFAHSIKSFFWLEDSSYYQYDPNNLTLHSGILPGIIDYCVNDSILYHLGKDGIVRISSLQQVNVVTESLDISEYSKNITANQIAANSKIIWIATDIGLLEYRFSNKQWRLISKKDGLGDYNILSLGIGENILYIGTMKGLSIYHYETFEEN